MRAGGTGDQRIRNSDHSEKRRQRTVHNTQHNALAGFEQELAADGHRKKAVKDGVAAVCIEDACVSVESEFFFATLLFDRSRIRCAAICNLQSASPSLCRPESFSSHLFAVTPPIPIIDGSER